MTMTLEEEFEEFKAKHKYKVLKVMILRYYESLLGAGCLNVSNINTLEKLADSDIISLLLKNDNLIRFNKLYEIAYNELAEEIEF